MELFKIGLVVIAAFVIQQVFSLIQMKHLSDEFVKLRRQGKVVFGRKSGGFHAGAIVMFLIDDDGYIKAGKKLEGTTILARVKPLLGFEGRYVGDLKEEDGPRNHRNLRKAIADAGLTYRKFINGEEIEAPPAPLTRLRRSAGNLLYKSGRNAGTSDRLRA